MNDVAPSPAATQILDVPFSTAPLLLRLYEAQVEMWLGLASKVLAPYSPRANPQIWILDRGCEPPCVLGYADARGRTHVLKPAVEFATPGSERPPAGLRSRMLKGPIEPDSVIGECLFSGDEPAEGALAELLPFLGTIVFSIQTSRRVIRLHGDIDAVRRGLSSGAPTVNFRELMGAGVTVLSSLLQGAPAWAVFVSYDDWRRGEPGAVVGNSQAPEGFMPAIREAVRRHFERDRGGEAYSWSPEPLVEEELGAVGEALAAAQIPSGALRVLAAPIFVPARTDADRCLPFAAVVCAPTAEAWDLAHLACTAFLREFRHIVWFEDELANATHLRSLLLKFPTAVRPETVAESVTEYLSARFSASEVAVLERRSDFLSLLTSAGVPESNVPLLRLSDTTALVCSVALAQEALYDPDVGSAPGPYLEVKSETKSQYAVPLMQQGDVVGVLLVALAVYDGLPSAHRGAIDALAAHCGVAVANARRALDERSVRHLTTDVLRRALFELVQAPHKQEERRGAASAVSLLQEFLTNLNEFHRTLEPLVNDVVELDLARCFSEYLRTERFKAICSGSPAVRLEWSPPTDESFSVSADANRLQRVFHILLANAYDATGSSGRIVVTLRKDIRDSAADRTMYAVLRFRDSGRGLSDSVLENLFSVGFTTKVQGAGLSLVVAERTIRAFGGRLQADNAPDGPGAVFEIWLPLQAARDAETG